MRWKGFVLLVLAVALAALLFTAERDRRPARPEESEPPRSDRSVEGAPEIPPDAPEVPTGWRLMKGIVLDARNLAPVPDARIVFSGPGDDLVALTDARGEWRLALPRHSPGYAWGSVQADGYLSDIVDVREFFGERLLTAAEPAFLIRADVALYGEVLGPDGLPLANARVESDCAEAVAVTDAAGRFGPLPAASGWVLKLEVATDKGIEWYETVRIPSEARDRHDVTIRIPPPRFVPGMTLDEEGKPLPGVLLRAGWGDRSASLTSGSDGRFRWPLLGAGTELRAEKAGYVSLRERTGIYPDAELEIRLERAASIEGRVVRRDGSPAPAGLVVTCRDASCPLGADGAFRLSPVAGSRTHLTVAYPLSPERLNPMEYEREVATVDPDLAVGEERTGFLIHLPRLFAHEGIVIDARTRRPIADAKVDSAFTNEEGRFVLWLDEKNDQDSEIALDVEAPGYAPLETMFVPGKPIELQPLRNIQVTVVTEAGEPLPGVTVQSFGSDFGVTDFDGGCVVHGHLGEDAALSVRPYRRDRTSLIVPADRSSVRVVIAGPRVRYVVVAVDENGDPLPDARLEYEDGTVRAASTAGRIDVFWSDEMPVLTAPGRRTSTIDPEYEPEGGVHEVRLEPTKPARARFLYTDGSPVVKIFVEGGGKERWTNAEGRVEFLGFAVGRRIRIEFSIPGWKIEKAHAVAGGPETVIRLPPRGEVVIRFDEAAASEEPEIHLYRSPQVWDLVPYFPTRRRGEIRLSVPAGRATLCLRIQPGVYRYYADFTVREGVPIRLDYDFPRFGEISGNVFGPDGKPLDGARIRLLIPGRQDIARSGEDGTFRTRHPGFLGKGPQHPVGRIRLLVCHDDCAPAATEPIDLSRDQNVAVTLPLGGTVRGRAIVAGGRPKVRLLTPDAIEDQDFYVSHSGEFSPWEHIRAGRHQIEIVSEDGRRWVREVEIEDGKETVVTFDLK